MSLKTLYSPAPLWFSSGLQYPSEIRAMIELRVACGISLNHAREDLFEYLIRRKDEVPALFIDSGAFSETPNKPFTSAVWEEKFCKYERLTKTYGDHCVFVAPDKIGDQAETLNRWLEHQHRLEQLQRHSYMIVPLQKGELSQSEMLHRAIGLWGNSVVAGIPFKKSATTYAEYIDFMMASSPSRVHILGVTPFGHRWRRITEINKQFTETHFTFDGCRIRALIGKNRAFTRGMHKRKHLPRHQAIYETLISLRPYLTHPGDQYSDLPLFAQRLIDD